MHRNMFLQQMLLQHWHFMFPNTFFSKSSQNVNLKEHNAVKIMALGYPSPIRDPRASPLDESTTSNITYTHPCPLYVPFCESLFSGSTIIIFGHFAAFFGEF